MLQALPLMALKINDNELTYGAKAIQCMHYVNYIIINFDCSNGFKQQWLPWVCNCHCNWLWNCDSNCFVLTLLLSTLAQRIYWTVVAVPGTCKSADP
jgi:hypothetical protein